MNNIILNIFKKMFKKRWVATEDDKIQELVVPSKKYKEIVRKYLEDKE